MLLTKELCDGEQLATLTIRSSEYENMRLIICMLIEQAFARAGGGPRPPPTARHLRSRGGKQPRAPKPAGGETLEGGIDVDPD